MNEGFSLIKLDGFAEPVNTLIEKVSGAIGGIAKPYQIKRLAKAEAEADIIKALAGIEIDVLKERAILRLINEEAKKQSNMESIIKIAAEDVNEDSKTQEIDDDWITYFFDRCKLVSDEEMQYIWGKILSGEANAPGKFSKRTLDLLSKLDKRDAELFSLICSFTWNINTYLHPLIYNTEGKVYKDNNIAFQMLQHLENVGLINYQGIPGYSLKEIGSSFFANYDKEVIVFKNRDKKDKLSVGRVIFTDIGEELASMINYEEISGFREYIIDVWEKEGFIKNKA